MTSSINQLRVNMLDMQSYQALQSNKPIIEHLIEDTDDDMVDASTEVWDFISNDVVSYDEYMQYCEENAVSQYNSSPSYTYVSTVQNSDGQSVRPVHIGKALATYSHYGERISNPHVETEV